MTKRRLKGVTAAVVGTAAVVAAFVFLQVPPYDGWRFHEVMTWRLQSTGPVTDVLPPENYSPAFQLREGEPLRLTWESDGPLVYHDSPRDAVLIVAAADGQPVMKRADGLEYSVPGAVTAAGPWAVNCVVSSTFGSRSRGVGDDWGVAGGTFMRDLPKGPTRGVYLLHPMFSRAEWARDPGDTYRLGIAMYVDNQPPITFTVSKPRGYYGGLPVEDYVVLAGVIAAVISLGVVAIRNRAAVSRRIKAMRESW